MGGSTNRRSRPVLLGWIVGFWIAMPLAAAPGDATVTGRVVTAAEPIAEATVYAYQLVEKSLRKVLTDDEGKFRFAALPAGLYKIVAHKAGYAPAVTLVTNGGEGSGRFVEVELEPVAGRTGGLDYWSVRSEIPADVLRELEIPLAPLLTAVAAAPIGSQPFVTHMSAVTGVERVAPQATSQMAAGRVGLDGRIGALRLQLQGDFQTIGPSGGMELAQFGAEGRASALRFNLEGPKQGRFDLATVNQSLVTMVDGESFPTDFSQVQVRYRREVGDSSSTGFLAQYVSESGAYSKGWVDPVTIPLASRAVRIEGTYARELGDSGRLVTGVRYRERLADYAGERAFSSLGDSAMERSFDAYGTGNWDLNSVFVIQYGLFTTLRDGRVSLTPRGGLVVRFAPEWQATVLAAQRVATDGDDYLPSEFTPTLLDQTLACENSEHSCYQAQLLWGDESANQLALGASYREYDRTVRLFFSDEFFARSEGLFLVPGDRLPEVHATVRRRLGPSVVTRLSTSYAAGGGGAFLAQNRRVYENEVAYLTTSLDTTFERSATGIFLAFHRIEQNLEPMRTAEVLPTALPASVSLERLELMLSQDLAPLFDLASDWAFRLGMELSRGASLFQADPDERDVLRHRLLTGFAVRF